MKQIFISLFFYSKIFLADQLESEMHLQNYHMQKKNNFRTQDLHLIENQNSSDLALFLIKKNKNFQK